MIFFYFREKIKYSFAFFAGQHPVNNGCFANLTRTHNPLSKITQKDLICKKFIKKLKKTMFSFSCRIFGFADSVRRKTMR